MSWDVLGHDRVVKILKNHILQENTRHAYLFAGIPGIGKRTLALQFAKALNCPEASTSAEGCSQCRVCRQIDAMQHPDLVVVQSEAPGSILKIDAVRELQQTLSLAPYESRWKIALLLRFDEANASAQNALLKTLEEPAENVKLFLTASSESAVLPTIASRCEIIRLRTTSVADLTQLLIEQQSQPEETAEIAAHLAAGRIGTAFSLVDDPDRMNHLIMLADEALGLLGQSIRERFQYAASFRDFRKRAELREVLQIWQSLYRDLYLLSVRQDEWDAPLTYISLREEMERRVRTRKPTAFSEFLNQIRQALSYLDANVSPQLLFENLMLKMP